jgi:uncharacterized protein (DUF1778 family)
MQVAVGKGDKMHWNTGKKYAKKDVVKASFLKVRCEERFRDKVKQAAATAGFSSVSAFIIAAIEEKIKLFVDTNNK